MAFEDDSTRRNRSKSWWKQRTKMERRLIFVMLVAILLIIALAVGTGVAAAASGRSSACLTAACVREAAHLLSRMNTSVDPCHDFYEFACGRFIEETELPDDKSEIDPLSSTGSGLNSQVRKLIIEKSNPEEIRPFTLLKKFYASCVNTSAIEKTGVDQIKTIFYNLGGLPILEGDNWIESSWVDITRKLREHGHATTHFISIDSDINPKNSSEYVISVDQATNEEIGDDNLKDGLKDSLVSAYAKFLIDLVVLFGVDKEFATKEVHDVIDFRAKIAKISAPKLEHVKLIVSANTSTVANLQNDYPSIPWLDLINGVMALPNKTILAQDKVVVVSYDYISEFENIINKTPKRVQANHALLQVLRVSIPFLPKTFREREQQFLGAVTGVTSALPRWDTCITQTTNYFHLAADALYVRRYVDEQSKKEVTEMVSYIRSVLVKILKEVEWMDQNTRRQAIEKAEAMKPHIAYPMELLDDKELEDYYSQLVFNTNNALDLIREVTKLKRDKALRFHGGPVVRTHWTTRLAAITINAVYDPQTNSIQIPSGIMQNEFYKKDRPRYINYGGLGMVIGHEITHGFDDTGKAFDKNGNSVDWWEHSTLEAYSSKSQCFIDQYGNYTVPELKVNLNGLNTLGENIADNGGMKEAYLAYLEWVKRNHEEPPLPALDYSSKQMFWIAAANAWCTKIRTSALEGLVIGDEHSPNRYRILGGFSNMRHFAEDFKCPVGSKMNPVKKCQIW